jgi:DNA-binding CsgD family transcriptional regulator
LGDIGQARDRRKTLPTDLQVKCLQKVRAGELWFEKSLTDSFLCARRVALTQREVQLVSLLSQGLKNKEIATTLMISEGTVKVYLSRLFQKVGVMDRFELALFGLKNLTTGQLPVGKNDQRPSGTSIPGLRSLVLERPAEREEPSIRETMETILQEFVTSPTRRYETFPGVTKSEQQRGPIIWRAAPFSVPRGAHGEAVVCPLLMSDRIC